MDKKTLSKQVIIEKGGIAKTSDFVAAGIPAVDIVNLCNTGYLERIRHGYYQLADGNTSSESQRQLFVWNRLFFIMAIVTLHLVNGLLLYRDLCPEQNWI